MKLLKKFVRILLTKICISELDRLLLRKLFSSCSVAFIMLLSRCLSSRRTALRTLVHEIRGRVLLE